MSSLSLTDARVSCETLRKILRLLGLLVRFAYTQGAVLSSQDFEKLSSSIMTRRHVRWAKGMVDASLFLCLIPLTSYGCEGYMANPCLARVLA